MQSSLINFSEDTKTNCYVVVSGLFVILSAISTKQITGNLISGVIRLIGIITLGFAVAALGKSILRMYNDTPDIMKNQSVLSNTAACSCLCLVVISLITYATYTLVF